MKVFIFLVFLNTFLGLSSAQFDYFPVLSFDGSGESSVETTTEDQACLAQEEIRIKDYVGNQLASAETIFDDLLPTNLATDDNGFLEPLLIEASIPILKENAKGMLSLLNGAEDQGWTGQVSFNGTEVGEHEFVVHESSCSVDCGNGTKTITKVKCTSSKCMGNPEQEPCQMPACPIKAKFEEWGPWTTCSKSCISSVQDQSTRLRTRTCYPKEACKMGTKEEEPCAKPFCPPPCPKYSVDSMATKQDSTWMTASLSFDRPQLNYGEFENMEVKIEPMNEISTKTVKKKFFVNDFNSTSVSDTFPNLKVGTAYQPNITVMFKVQGSTLMTLRCSQEPFEAKEWKCDNGKTIPWKKVCDRANDCEDQSDESKQLCKGKKWIRNMISVVFWLFLLAGYLTYFLGKVTRIGIDDFDLDDQERQENGPAMGAIRVMNTQAQVVQHFVKPRNNLSGTVLLPEEVSSLTERYNMAHNAGDVTNIYWVSSLVSCENYLTNLEKSVAQTSFELAALF